MKRDYLFCDEVYSYGLANSNEYTFLHPGENDEPLDNWVSGSYFSDYMNYCDEAFNYKAAYVNQERDVHPPLYYMLLHTVCRFFKEAGYSAIPGIVLNLIILAFVDIVLMYVAANLLESRWRGLAATVLWGISSVGISNCMLIRMYLLQIFEVLLFVAAHIYIEAQEKDDGALLYNAGIYSVPRRTYPLLFLLFRGWTWTLRMYLSPVSKES